MKIFWVKLVAMAALGSWTAHGSGPQRHVVSDATDEGNSINSLLDFHDGLLMSANPSCCGNHWGTASAGFYHGLLTSANPYYCGHHRSATVLTNTTRSSDGGDDDEDDIEDDVHDDVEDDVHDDVEDDVEADVQVEVESTDESTDNAGAPPSPASGTDADASEGQLDDTVGYTDVGGDSAGLHTEPADEACGEFCSGGNTDAAEEQPAGRSGPVNEAEDGGVRFSSEQSESTIDESPQPSAGVPDQEDSDAVPLEATFRVHQRLRKDAVMRVVLTPGSHTESASLEMKVTSRHLLPSAKRSQTIQLTPDTRVQAASLENFHVSNSEGAWTFIAVNRVQRDVWVSALVNAIEGPDHTAKSGETDTTSGGGSAAPEGNPTTSTTDVLEVKTSARGMKPSQVTLLGSELTACKVAKDGTVTKSCKKMTLNQHSEVVGVIERQGKKGFNCALLRVTADPWSDRKANSWTIDAGSADDKARWLSLIEDAIHEAQDGGGIYAGKVEDPYYWRPFDSRYRGSKLGPKDESLVPGLYLALAHKSPFTMEVTEIGDLLISPGHRPDRTQEPLWAHRATGSVSGLTNGGLGCVVEAFWHRMMGEEDTEVTLSVKNGRWRVRRGMLCTLGSSPAPEGSFRRFIPGDERGSAIRGAFLQLLEDGTAVIDSADGILWDSYWG